MILPSCVIPVYFRSLGIRHVIQIFWYLFIYQFMVEFKFTDVIDFQQFKLFIDRFSMCIIFA